MYDLFKSIETLSAVKVVLQMGFIPRHENIEEFSAEDRIRANTDLDLNTAMHEKWFKINPPGRFMENGISEESDLTKPVRKHEIMVVNENQCAMLREAVEFIDHICASANIPLEADTERIRYIRKMLPVSEDADP